MEAGSLGIPLAYFGPINYFRAIARVDQGYWAAGELFPKQTYRNRCEIYGANGKLSLSIPVHKPFGHKTRMHEVRISQQENWQAIHWKSIESAYRKSPYFDYYADRIKHLVFLEEDYLWKFNQSLTESLCGILDISIHSFTTSHKKGECTPEWNQLVNPKIQIEGGVDVKNYIQVFSEKFGFLPNLSILDLLFNEGPHAQLHIHR
jgi:hypothetical protein